ncbi:MAG: DUF503 domain-containing protein [Psychromonas sp.]
MVEQTCFITLLSIELMIPHAQSLKDKRQQIRGLKERIRSRFNASVAEVGYLDKWQRSVLAVCLVGNDKRLLIASATKIRVLCEEAADLSILNIEQEWL